MLRGVGLINGIGLNPRLTCLKETDEPEYRASHQASKDSAGAAVSLCVRSSDDLIYLKIKQICSAFNTAQSRYCLEFKKPSVSWCDDELCKYVS